jgi:phenylalanyl-tRNA synthetase alpha subunit
MHVSFAFGMSLERVAMQRCNIDDIRFAAILKKMSEIRNSEVRKCKAC